MTAPCPSFGFVVRIGLRPGLAGPDGARFWDTWVDFLASRGLCCTGGGGETHEYVVASDASQATESDREAVRAWLAARPELNDVEVSQLIDLDQAV